MAIVNPALFGYTELDETWFQQQAKYQRDRLNLQSPDTVRIRFDTDPEPTNNPLLLLLED